jgi:hypothetical protein
MRVVTSVKNNIEIPDSESNYPSFQYWVYSYHTRLWYIQSRRDGRTIFVYFGDENSYLFGRYRLVGLRSSRPKPSSSPQAELPVNQVLDEIVSDEAIFRAGR